MKELITFFLLILVLPLYAVDEGDDYPVPEVCVCAGINCDCLNKPDRNPNNCVCTTDDCVGCGEGTKSPSYDWHDERDEFPRSPKEDEWIYD